jgi:hypothetical protein
MFISALLSKDDGWLPAAELFQKINSKQFQAFLF